MLALSKMLMALDQGFWSNHPRNTFVPVDNKPESTFSGALGSDEDTYGASAHSDYGMVTLLVDDGVPGLQVSSLLFG